MMTKEGWSTKIVCSMTPGAGVLVLGLGHISYIVKMHYFFKDLLLYFWGWFRQTQKDGFGEVHVDSYCINRLYCSFPLPFLIFIIPPANEVVYSMMELLICKYEPF